MIIYNLTTTYLLISMHDDLIKNLKNNIYRKIL